MLIEHFGIMLNYSFLFPFNLVHYLKQEASFASISFEVKQNDNWTFYLSEQLYKSGRIRPTLSTGQFSNLSKNQCYISRWTLWHIKFGAVTKTEALGVISSFRGWISLYRASRQNVLFFSRYAEWKFFLVWSTMTLSGANSQEKKGLTKFNFSSWNWTKCGGNGVNRKIIGPHPKLSETQNQVTS